MIGEDQPFPREPVFQSSFGPLQVDIVGPFYGVGKDGRGIIRDLQETAGNSQLADILLSVAELNQPRLEGSDQRGMVSQHSQITIGSGSEK